MKRHFVAQRWLASILVWRDNYLFQTMFLNFSSFSNWKFNVQFENKYFPWERNMATMPILARPWTTSSHSWLCECILNIKSFSRMLGEISTTMCWFCLYFATMSTKSSGPSFHEPATCIYTFLDQHINTIKVVHKFKVLHWNRHFKKMITFIRV